VIFEAQRPVILAGLPPSLVKNEYGEAEGPPWTFVVPHLTVTNCSDTDKAILNFRLSIKILNEGEPPLTTEIALKKRHFDPELDTWCKDSNWIKECPWTLPAREYVVASLAFRAAPQSVIDRLSSDGWHDVIDQDHLYLKITDHLRPAHPPVLMKIPGSTRLPDV
jgi:hypothetical protein